MFKIKNGRFISKEVSFDMPEGFNLVLNDCYPMFNLVRFASDNKVIKYGRVFIEISLQNSKNPESYDMAKLHDYGAQVRSEPFEVTREKGTAKAAYFTSGEYMDVNEEHYLLKEPINGDNLFKVRVYNRAAKGKKITAAVEDSLQMPIVKKFLDSIQYN